MRAFPHPFYYHRLPSQLFLRRFPLQRNLSPHIPSPVDRTTLRSYTPALFPTPKAVANSSTIALTRSLIRLPTSRSSLIDRTTDTFRKASRYRSAQLESSVSATALALSLLLTVAFSIVYNQVQDLENVEQEEEPSLEETTDQESDEDYYQRVLKSPAEKTTEIRSIPYGSSYYAHMAQHEIKQGWPGNLTAEQEVKLRELWWQLSRLVGITEGRVSVESPTASVKGDEKKKSSRLGFLKKSTGGSASAADTDKYGQKEEYYQALTEQTPEQMRRTIWSFMKADEPDALLCRFLRARKWDVSKALVMLVSTVRWRGKVTHLDDEIVFRGEEYYQNLANNGTGKDKQIGEGFMFQYHKGKAWLRGTDKLGRPICCVHVRHHHASDQVNDSLEQFTIFQIETARMMLRPPVDTAMVIFDLGGFGMSNMDYVPLKFMIKIFEANYPESLGQICVHRAPWIFNSLWNVIKGWLDPVVASKIVFTKDAEELGKYIDKEQIPKSLGGPSDWEFKYIPPVAGENKIMQDRATHDALQKERWGYVEEYEQATLDWAQSEGQDEKAQARRMATYEKLRTNYWKLDPYVRARTYFDRIGVLQPGGLYEPYPKHDPEYYIKQMTDAPAATPQAATQQHISDLEKATKRLSVISTMTTDGDVFYDAVESQ